MGNFLALPCPAKKMGRRYEKRHVGVFACHRAHHRGHVGCIMRILCVDRHSVFDLFSHSFCTLLRSAVSCTLTGSWTAVMPSCQDGRFRRNSRSSGFPLRCICCYKPGFHGACIFCMCGKRPQRRIDFPDLCMIPSCKSCSSRFKCCSEKPIGHSQYAQGKGSSDDRQKKGQLWLLPHSLLYFAVPACFLPMTCCLQPLSSVRSWR